MVAIFATHYFQLILLDIFWVTIMAFPFCHSQGIFCLSTSSCFINIHCLCFASSSTTRHYQLSAVGPLRGGDFCCRAEAKKMPKARISVSEILGPLLQLLLLTRSDSPSFDYPCIANGERRA